MESFILGLDFGTSGVRAVITDTRDRDPLFKPYQIALPTLSHRPTKARHEQDPLKWREALIALFQKIPVEIKQKIAHIIIDATSSTVCLIDHDRPEVPMTSAIMYDDARALKQSEIIAEELTDLIGTNPQTSSVLGATSTLAKVQWLYENITKPTEVQLCHQADYLNGLLTGEYQVTDENNALKLGYDPINRCWPEEIKRLCPLPLPEVRPAGAPLAPVSKNAAQLFQIPQSCQVYCGTTDSIAAFLATGAGQIGEACSSLGSTLAIKLLSDAPIYAPESGLYSHRLGNQWLVGGASNSGGAVLTHFFDLPRLKALIQQLKQQHPASLPLPTGLNYYPLTKPGERFPVADPNLLPKLTPIPKNDSDFLLGLIEGLTQIEALAYEKLQQLGAPEVKAIYSVGGGVKNAIWQQARQQILSAPIKKPLHTEAAFGVTKLVKSI
jgi:xylulokinase